MEPIIGATSAQAVQIVDANQDSFMKEVVEASRELPVIVDFWAEWCGPCKQLMPTLERQVKEAAGRVKLVKVNADENQALCAQLRVQSLPTVMAFKNGQPVDGFMGAVPESQLKSFIQRLSGDTGPTPSEQLLAMGDQALEAGDLETAMQAFSQVLQGDQENLTAIGGFVRCYVQAGKLEEARELLAQIPEAKKGDAAIAAAMAQLTLAEQAEGSDDSDAAIQEAQAKVDANGDDFEARMELSAAYQARHQFTEAAEHLLYIISKDRAWQDDAARKQLLTLFDAAGPTDPFTIQTRRKLSSLLFS